MPITCLIFQENALNIPLSPQAILIKWGTCLLPFIFVNILKNTTILNKDDSTSIEIAQNLMSNIIM